MKNHSTGVEAAMFLLEILRRIPKGKGRSITVKELMEQLAELGYKRTPRSFQRTLNTLCEHFDIEKDDRANAHAYRWKEFAKGFEISRLTLQESLVLMLAEEHLKNLLPANIMKSMKPFFDEARYQKQFGKETLEYKWLDKVCSVPTSLPLLPAHIPPAIFEAVSTALFENRWLEIEYQNQDGEKRRSNVMPLALAEQGASIYLIVRYEGSEKNYMLVLHRIKKARLLTFTFDRPKDFSLKKYQAEGHLGFGQGKMVKLTFKIERRTGFHLTETPISADQIILEEGDDFYIMQATLPENNMLEWWISHFGEDFEELERQTIEKSYKEK